jgi:hypothetical protein
MSVNQLAPSTVDKWAVNQSGKGELAVDQSGINQLTLHQFMPDFNLFS